LVITILFAAMLAFSDLGKIRRDPRQVRVIHKAIGVSLRYFPFWPHVSLPEPLAWFLASAGLGWVWLRGSVSFSTLWAPLSRICVWVISTVSDLLLSC
jgi:hypothetical protein